MLSPYVPLANGCNTRRIGLEDDVVVDVLGSLDNRDVELQIALGSALGVGECEVVLLALLNALDRAGLGERTILNVRTRELPLQCGGVLVEGEVTNRCARRVEGQSLALSELATNLSLEGRELIGDRRVESNGCNNVIHAALHAYGCGCTCVDGECLRALVALVGERCCALLACQDVATIVARNEPHLLGNCVDTLVGTNQTLRVVDVDSAICRQLLGRSAGLVVEQNFERELALTLCEGVILITRGRAKRYGKTQCNIGYKLFHCRRFDYALTFILIVVEVVLPSASVIVSVNE